MSDYDGPTLHAFRGLPGAGKTTQAVAMVVRRRR